MLSSLNEWLNGLTFLYRGNWEIARQDLNDSQIITMIPTERDFMDNYDDYFPIRTRSSTLCCRTIAIIVSFWHQNPMVDVVSCISCLMKIRHCDCIIEQFMALLVLRHTLPLMIGDNGEYSLALFLVRLMISIHQYLLLWFNLFLTWWPLLCILLLKIKLLVLRTAGILFPILVMVRALASFHCRRRQQQVISLLSRAVTNAILIMFSLAAADMA